MTYIENHDRQEGCIFCSVLAQPDGPANLIVQRGRASFVILNRYPYTSGHLMIVPFEHRSTLEDLDAPVRSEMMELAAQSMRVLRRVYEPQAFNMGANIGEAAGAGVKEHFHIHIVPRWVGDTNFMSTLGDTRVLPEILEDTFERVQAAFQN